MSISFNTSRGTKLFAALLFAGVSFAYAQYPAASGEAAVVIPPPAMSVKAADASGKAVFAGGCFWGVQGVFQHVKGVKNAVSGYVGGAKETAVYEAIGSGQTGHAEAVEITYDPSQISYGDLLQIFFSVAHNPTELNRQGPDAGTQYRSAVFPVNAEQRKLTEAYIAQLDGAKVFPEPIATKTEAEAKFYPAEEYHQDFMVRNPTYPYIVHHDLPKVENLKKLFPQRFTRSPALVAGGAS